MIIDDWLAPILLCFDFPFDSARESLPTSGSFTRLARAGQSGTDSVMTVQGAATFCLVDQMASMGCLNISTILRPSINRTPSSIGRVVRSSALSPLSPVGPMTWLPGAIPPNSAERGRLPRRHPRTPAGGLPGIDQSLLVGLGLENPIPGSADDSLTSGEPA